MGIDEGGWQSDDWKFAKPCPTSVFPAKAGTQSFLRPCRTESWTPAFAEETEDGEQKEKDLKTLYNHLSHENDKAFIHEFFASSKKERNEKLTLKLEKWKSDQHQTFDDFWERLKNDMLTKQEN